jgi:hypothetical protein
MGEIRLKVLRIVARPQLYLKNQCPLRTECRTRLAAVARQREPGAQRNWLDAAAASIQITGSSGKGVKVACMTGCATRCCRTLGCCASDWCLETYANVRNPHKASQFVRKQTITLLK